MATNNQSIQNNPFDIFIEGWGRMAGAWGINKMMAQIYALLYVSKDPLSLEEMSDKLKTSRSNVSLNVRSLLDLGMARKVVIRGDRRDYYTAEEDIIKVAKRLAAERKKRELDPAIEIVEKAIMAADNMAAPHPAGDDENVFCADRLKTFLSLMLIVEGVFDSFIDGASRNILQLEEIKTNNI
jgi:DNA-binding transcriptional regulator GbsR (MarR family)